jgi:hypothetical protein
MRLHPVGERQAEFKEQAMASQDDWVEDVRRWYYGGNAPAADGDAVAPADDTHELGYETAQPCLQARHFPDAPVPGSKSGT